MSPGNSIGLHSHNEDEEIYYITKGTGRVIDDGVEMKVELGDAIVTGGDSKHALENIGKDDLEFIAVIHYIQ